ncbi:PDK, partial [Symbiodinium necroappetens]
MEAGSTNAWLTGSRVLARPVLKSGGVVSHAPLAAHIAGGHPRACPLEVARPVQVTRSCSQPPPSRYMQAMPASTQHQRFITLDLRDARRAGCRLLVARTCSQLRRRYVVPAFTRSFTSASSSRLEVVEVDSCVLRWAEQTPTSVTLRDLCEIGLDSRRRREHGIFLHRELRIRLAQRILELTSLPYRLGARRGIRDVIEWYTHFMHLLEDSPSPATEELDEEFTNLLTRIFEEHSEVIQAMAFGVQDLIYELQEDYAQVQAEVDGILRRFFTARIGMRFLIQHHIESFRNREGHSGILQIECDPSIIAQKAAKDSSMLCRAHKGQAPPIKIHHTNPSTFTYVPMHLHYMLVEVFKNSCRAVVERHADGFDDLLPAIHCHIVHGNEDVTIRVSDEGGGISRAHLPNIWKFMYTTSKKSPWAAARKEEEFQTKPGDSASNPLQRPKQGGVLAGFGVGLTLGRLYAKYFGGDLKILSLDGFGTDVFLHLNRLGTACEDLPQNVLYSPSMRDSSALEEAAQETLLISADEEAFLRRELQAFRRRDEPPDALKKKANCFAWTRQSPLAVLHFSSLKGRVHPVSEHATFWDEKPWRRMPLGSKEMALQEAVDFVRRATVLWLANAGNTWPGDWLAMLRKACNDMVAPATASAIKPLSRDAAVRLGEAAFQRLAVQLEVELAEPLPAKVKRVVPARPAVTARRSVGSESTMASSVSPGPSSISASSGTRERHTASGPYIQDSRLMQTPLHLGQPWTVTPRRLKASPGQLPRPCNGLVNRNGAGGIWTPAATTVQAAGLSLEEEFAQLRHDMAAERAERQALASLVETLLQERQPPRRRCSVASQGAHDGYAQEAAQEWMPNFGSLMGQEWGQYRQYIIKEEEAQTADIDTLEMGRPSPSSPSSALPTTTLDLPPPPANRTDLKLFTQAQATEVHDKVLADTRAALDHLEKQLCLSVSPQTTSAPVTTSGSPGFNLEDGDRRELDLHNS